MDLTRQLRGKEVAAVMTNGHLLAITMKDGSEILVAWCDDNGRAIKGKPVVERRGVRLDARGFRDLINYPRSA